MDNKIIGRMKRLLAMSQDSDSEYEASIAMRRLHSMLAKYNVSLESLEDSDDEVGEDGFEVANWPWKRMVLNSVSKLYFCKSYYGMVRKNYANYFIVGTETNRVFAMGIVKMVFKTIESQAKIASLKEHGKVDSTFVVSFKNGAGERIAYRCYDLIDLAKKGKLDDGEIDGSMLPALVGIYEYHFENAESFLNDKGLVNSTMRTKANDRVAMAKGREAGSKVQLTRVLHNRVSPKLIGRK